MHRRLAARRQKQNVNLSLSTTGPNLRSTFSANRGKTLNLDFQADDEYWDESKNQDNFSKDLNGSYNIGKEFSRNEDSELINIVHDLQDCIEEKSEKSQDSFEKRKEHLSNLQDWKEVEL